METFINTHELRLTPLSPIHIGCGMDMEPTQFVIEDEILYAFEPSQVPLSEQQAKKLLNLAKSASIGGLQSFFKDNAAIYKSNANEFIAVSPSLAREYESNIGQVVQREADGAKVFNRFFFERTVNNPITKEVYIPGTSVKGALRTGLVDRKQRGQALQKGDKSAQIEKRHIGDFADGMSRFLKISDFMPSSSSLVARKLLYAVNRKKAKILDENGLECNAKGVTARKEVICPAQYRAFNASMVIQNNSDPKYAGFKTSVQEWVDACNTYHLPRFEKELDLLNQRGFVDPVWTQSITSLMADLVPAINTGTLALIRLGRYGGAESKTFSGGIATIKIMQGRNNPPKYEPTTKTIWLAANNASATADALPFGWAIIEVNPAGENEALKQWCANHSQNNPDFNQIKASIQAERQAQRDQVAAEKAERDQQLHEEAEREAQALLEQQSRELALSAMSEALRQVEELSDAIAQKKAEMDRLNRSKGYPQNQDVDAQAKKLVQEAKAAGNWTDAEKERLKEVILNELPKVVEKMSDAKENRKRFKLSEL